MRRGQGASGGFSVPQQPSASSPRAATLSGAAPLAGLEGLLALQIVDDPLQQKRRSVQRGKSILDLLDGLKVAMLSGRVPKDTLQRIARSLRQREPSADPILEGVIAEIELRAAVELAKHGIVAF